MSFVVRHVALFLCLCTSAFISCESVVAQTLPFYKKPPTEITINKEEVERFGTAIAQIKNLYVTQTSDKQLFAEALRGMLTGLDPHSSYLSKEEFAFLRECEEGHFVGLGIEITQEDDMIKVISPIDDTPAQIAGIIPGDYILAVDGQSLVDCSLDLAIQKLRGKKGSTTTLTVVNEGDKKQRTIRIKRETIHIQSVKSKLLDNEFGYIRITNFQNQTGEESKKAIQSLQKQANGQLKGLILDLRNSPGGILETSADVADLFLDAKSPETTKIFYTKGRTAESQTVAYATKGDVLADAPLIVLINEGTASAAEIVTGALQDHKRAIVMGTRSFGKGSVQTIFPLDDETAIKLTTALYYTPSGRVIQAKGIQPDIVTNDLKFVKKHDDALAPWKLRENDLAGHLKHDALSTTAMDNQSAVAASDSKLATTDYQLFEALKLLKSMRVVQDRKN